SAEDVEQEQAGLRGRHEATPVEVAQRAGGLLGTIGRGLVDAALRLRERRETGFFDPAHHRTGQVAARQLADLASLQDPLDLGAAETCGARAACRDERVATVYVQPSGCAL